MGCHGPSSFSWGVELNVSPPPTVAALREPVAMCLALFYPRRRRPESANVAAPSATMSTPSAAHPHG